MYRFLSLALLSISFSTSLCADNLAQTTLNLLNSKHCEALLYSHEHLAPNEVSSSEKFDGMELIQRLGRGGFSEVWRAKMVNNLGETIEVVIKRVRKDLSPELRAISIANLKAEAEIEKRILEETSLVADKRTQKLLRVRLNRDVPYLVFESIQAVSLRDYLSNTQAEPLSLPQALVIFMRLAETTGQIHQLKDSNSNSLAHGDLKPENILITPDLNPILIDFGIVRYSQEDLKREKELRSQVELSNGLGSTVIDSAVTPKLIGTVSYLPPEVIEEKINNPVPTTDVFQLGLILKEMLNPINGLAYYPQTEKEMRFYNDLRVVHLKALHADPKKRQPDAKALYQEMLSVFERHAEGTVVSFVEKALGHKKVVAGTIAAALTLGAGVEAWQHYTVYREREGVRIAKEEAVLRVEREKREYEEKEKLAVATAIATEKARMLALKEAETHEKEAAVRASQAVKAENFRLQKEAIETLRAQIKETKRILMILKTPAPESTSKPLLDAKLVSKIQMTGGSYLKSYPAVGGEYGYDRNTVAHTMKFLDELQRVISENAHKLNANEFVVFIDTLAHQIKENESSLAFSVNSADNNSFAAMERLNRTIFQHAFNNLHLNANQLIHLQTTIESVIDTIRWYHAHTRERQSLIASFTDVKLNPAFDAAPEELEKQISTMNALLQKRMLDFQALEDNEKN